MVFEWKVGGVVLVEVAVVSSDCEYDALMIFFWFFDCEFVVVIGYNFKGDSVGVFEEELGDGEWLSFFLCEESALPIVFVEFSDAEEGGVDKSFDYFVLNEIFLYSGLDWMEDVFGGGFFFFVGSLHSVEKGFFSIFGEVFEDKVKIFLAEDVFSDVDL